MTAKTVAERSNSYRARQRAKLARYEAALREVDRMAHHCFNGDRPATEALSVAGNAALLALNDQ
jgi:hypothetical protein